MSDKEKELVAAKALVAAEADLEFHKEFGVSLNPFSTAGARYEWQKGFEATEQDPDEALNAYWQRGFAAARLVNGDTGQ